MGKILPHRHQTRRRHRAVRVSAPGPAEQRASSALQSITAPGVTVKVEDTVA